MLSIGIVGLPNVGKSTLFKAVTNKQVDIQNYPFTTIEPNVGVVEVPDERVDQLTAFSKSAKKLYATIEFIDIAGLVKGASQGEGLGNKFLANIREVDAIAQVVRVFEDSNIIRESPVDPVSDIEVIRTELELADLQAKSRRSEKSGPRPQASGENALPPLDLLATKKVIYVLNVSEEQLQSGWQPGKELLDAMQNANYVIMCNKLELELSEMVHEEKVKFLADLGLPESGLDRLIREAYHTLGLLSFLTTGPDESRAWTAHIGDLIPHASRAIHTDFERLFIRAEVINWKTLLDAGSHVNAKAHGLVRTVGKDYVIQDGDVVEILIGR